MLVKGRYLTSENELAMQTDEEKKIRLHEKG